MKMRCRRRHRRQQGRRHRRQRPAERGRLLHGAQGGRMTTVRITIAVETPLAGRSARHGGRAQRAPQPAVAARIPVPDDGRADGRAAHDRSCGARCERHGRRHGIAESHGEGLARSSASGPGPQCAEPASAGSSLERVIGLARTKERIPRLALETGGTEPFADTWRFYEAGGFKRCGAFLDYPDTAYSRFYDIPSPCKNPPDV